MTEKKCDQCNDPQIFIETPNLTHYGKMVCTKCDKWFSWVKHPLRENMRTKTSKYSIEQILQHREMKEVFCWFCLREQERLGSCETMTRDHIQELDKGGKDELNNLQILCSACHKLKNWARLYMNWHLKK
jgi:hypothetical protein